MQSASSLGETCRKIKIQSLIYMCEWGKLHKSLSISPGTASESAVPMGMKMFESSCRKCSSGTALLMPRATNPTGHLQVHSLGIVARASSFWNWSGLTLLKKSWITSHPWGISGADNFFSKDTKFEYSHVCCAYIWRGVQTYSCP